MHGMLRAQYFSFLSKIMDREKKKNYSEKFCLKRRQQNVFTGFKTSLLVALSFPRTLHHFCNSPCIQFSSLPALA